MAGDPGTLLFYEAQASRYAAEGSQQPHPALAGFLARLAPGAHILELGCGAGNDAAAMLAAGFEVDPTDGSAALAQIATERLGRPVRVLPFEALEARAEYDAVWANASLLHVPRRALSGILALIHTALRPGGLFFASFKTGGPEGPDTHGRYFNRPDPAWLLQACGSGWELLGLRLREGGGFGGEPAIWLHLILRRRAYCASDRTAVSGASATEPARPSTDHSSSAAIVSGATVP